MCDNTPRTLTTRACIRGAHAMASSQSIPSAEPLHIDLIRRYCPGLAVHTHAQVAEHVSPDANGCWPWDGHINPDGYADVWCAPTLYGYQQSVHVHRYMYDVLVGPVPYGHHVHHRCQHKSCWHPCHLEAVTPQEHLQRHGRAPMPPAPWQPPTQLAFAWLR
jgi:hypothetical protein